MPDNNRKRQKAIPGLNYKIVNIRTQAIGADSGSILIIYTGGTLGMSYDKKGSLIPFNFGKVVEKIPSLEFLNLRLTVISFPEPIDSSNVLPSHWQNIAYIIDHNYDSYDGFIIIHGTDTMAYSASALSYMLEGLSKPVIFTGAQLPIEMARTDARENLATALEISAEKTADGQPLVKEVCIFFNHILLRGNRSKKVQSTHFDAFESENYPNLAEAGIKIEYNFSALKQIENKPKLRVQNQISSNVALLKIFPGINEEFVNAVVNTKGLKGLVLETFGSGNTPTYPWFLACLKRAIDHGIIIFNVSQCNGGHVSQGKYETSSALEKMGVLSGMDISAEAAITKMMYLFGKYSDIEMVKKSLQIPIAGEMSVNDSHLK